MEQHITLFMILFMQASAVSWLCMSTAADSLRCSARRAFLRYLPVNAAFSVVYSFVPPMNALTVVVVMACTFTGWFYFFHISNENKGKLLFVVMISTAHLLLCNTVWLLLCSVTEVVLGTYSHTAYYNILLLGLPLALFLPVFARLLKKMWRDAKGLTLPWYRLALIPVTFILIYITIYVLRSAGYDYDRTWYILMAVITVCFFTTCSQLIFALGQAEQAARSAESLHLVESQIHLQAARFDKLAAHSREISGLRHDLRQHAITAHQLVAEGKNDAALDYLSQYVAETQEIESPAISSNAAVDTIVRYYMAAGAASGVKVDATVAFPQDLALADTDLCVVLGNLLENALEACKAIPQGTSRWVRLEVRPKGNKLLISQRNSFTGSLRRGEDGEILSTKESGGLGLRSVENIARRDGGLARFYTEGDVFVSEVLMVGKVGES